MSHFPCSPRWRSACSTALCAWSVFFGLGILGLVIAFIAVRMDLERDAASSEPRVLEEQFKARDRMSRAERADFQAAQKARLKPLFVAQVVAAAFVILGFGFHFLL